MKRKRKPYRGQRRRRSVPADIRTKRRLIRLGVCMGILAAASLLRMIFPAAFESIGNKITETVDFRSAFSAIGEGISGEKGFKDTVVEVFSHMTGQGNGETTDEDITAASNFDDENELNDEDSSEVIADKPEEETPDKTDESDAIAQMVSSFKDAQDMWSSYELPNDVTYEYLPLDFEYSTPSQAVVTSGFGYREHPNDGAVKFHYGTDFGGQTGDDVFCFSDGTVTAVGESTTLGLYMIVSHDSCQTLYAHLDSVSVSSQDVVLKGQVIGTMGESGNATAPCLHFELTVDGTYVNPEYYI